MDIDVYFDPICPWCYIGKRRLQRALGLRPAVSAHLNWKTFMLNPDMPPQGMDRDLYLLNKFGSEARVRRLLGALEDVGQSEEIAFNFDTIRQTPSTLDAHRLVLFAADFGQGEPVVEALFGAYFTEGRDIGDLDELAAIGRNAGLDGQALDTYLSSDQDKDLIRSQNRKAHRKGVNGVPCFIMDTNMALQGAQNPEVIVRLIDAAAA